jgi:hypothetical protein
MIAGSRGGGLKIGLLLFRALQIARRVPQSLRLGRRLVAYLASFMGAAWRIGGIELWCIH